ncbi:MAG: substrate-binding domain-containing protein [Acidimicrobiaceae bacterium]|nr:substrate-binding domain-containing protein [Acidimicrobiaceae bacterium]MCY4175429.1 substrate-binding domain-containing protein [Acidimicrobiaceae bacterium]MCY4279175.1 substrate-binding domain-containing protein [Acidimicrobiaceae bacterium]MCY4293489.1 substrate-binding domain-containing protein [Acidimicrobiaceae bacterium]
MTPVGNTRPQLRPHQSLTALAVAVVSAAVVAVAVSSVAAGCGGDSGEEIVVMAASSLSDAVEAVIADHDDVNAVFAGSSTLVSQLAAGAAADVLMTADGATMNQAIADGDVQGAPSVIASNSLVLATAPANPGGVTRLADLSRGDLLIGLCAEAAPCGALSQQALRGARIEAAPDTLELNVRALAAKLSLGELDAGLIYRSDALAVGLPVVEAPQLESLRNLYHIAAVSARPTPRVQALLDDFTAPDGAAAMIFAAQGFGPP